MFDFLMLDLLLKEFFEKVDLKKKIIRRQKSMKKLPSRQELRSRQRICEYCPWANFSFILFYISPGPIDASKTGFTNYTTTVVCTPDTSYPLTIEARDAFGNMALYRADQNNYFKIKVTEVRWQYFNSYFSKYSAVQTFF